MSFDPITGIWAAKKAAEIVGASGGGSGGGLAVVEITTSLVDEDGNTTSNTVILTSEESAQLQDAASKQMPCVIKKHSQGNTTAYLFNYAYYAGMHVFTDAPGNSLGVSFLGPVPDFGQWAAEPV